MPRKREINPNAVNCPKTYLMPPVHHRGRSITVMRIIPDAELDAAIASVRHIPDWRVTLAERTYMTVKKLTAVINKGLRQDALVIDLVKQCHILASEHPLISKI